MKRFYSFIALMMLVASFSMTATAQHYVKVVKNTESINGQPYSQGTVLPIEIDSAQSCCIKIVQKADPQFTNKGKDLHRGGVVDNRIFDITKFDVDIKKVEFTDDNNETRSQCFKQAQILVQVGEDYLAYSDIDFLDAIDVKKAIGEVKKEILEACTYDSQNECLYLTNIPYKYKYKDNMYKDDMQYNVSLSEDFEFFTGDKNIPNVKIRVSEFKKKVDSVMGNDPGKNNLFDKIKEHLWIWIVGVVAALGIIGLVLWLIFKKKNSPEREHDFDDDSFDKKKMKHKGKDKKHNKEHYLNAEQPASVAPAPVPSCGDTELLNKITDVLAQVSTNQNKLGRLENTMKNIEQLVSNKDEKKLLDQKNKELEAEKKKLSDAIAEKKTLVAEKDAANQRIGELQAEIKSLKAGSSIEGAAQINGYSAFVTFAQKIMQECMKVEGIVVKYLNSLKEKDSQILVPFILKFQAAKDNEKLARWNGIIATLDLKGYVKDEEYVSYLAKESDKVGFLEKRFFQDILRPYVGAVILLLEQIRTAPQIKVSMACNDNIEGYINSICTKCAERGVTIDYKKLYEKVTDFESLEIEDNVPNSIKKYLSHIEEEELLLYVDRYAVNLKTGELTEKTRCFIKI